jgi:hypothetical protein
MVRNLATAAPLTIVIACGLYDLIKRKLNIIWNLILGIMIFVSFGYFVAIYYYHFPFQMGENYQYGYKQAAEYINANYNKYDKIIVDPRFGKVNIYVGVPHLYLPYFTNLDPKKLLNRIDTEEGLFFDKYQIRSINWTLEIVKPKTLYLVPFDNQPDIGNNKLRTVEEIRLPSGEIEFKLLTMI